ncbi:MAG TPA: stage II sporulation protein M, partial [Thermoguttaceae bacterium]|nr:stage II sporulation protein M [Thermoguttaceae bacterium]
ANWQELDHLCDRMEGRSGRKIPAATISRFTTLYRAACADLALADAYQLPSDTVRYLHQLVGRAHNQLYRSRTFNLQSWSHQLFVTVPRRLFDDNCLRLAFCIFWGVFLLSGVLARSSPSFAHRLIGKPMIEQMEESFSEPVSGRGAGMGGTMVGFYIFNNTGIGLRCFAFGLLFGIGGLYVTVFNAAMLGAVFGHMTTVTQSENFFHFVTAHGPFELTAIVLSAAAGMRLGFSLVDTHGYGRVASLRMAANEAMPTMGAAIVMFLAAALIEGFLSPSPAPYWVKAAVAIISSGMLMFYFILLGYPRDHQLKG